MATLYIATDGNDSTGDGSQALPWLTFTKAIGEATAGDTVEFAAGTYTGTMGFTKNLTAQAATGATVTVAPTSGVNVVFTGTTGTIIVIDGIDLDGSSLDNSTSATVDIDDATTTITIKNLTITAPGTATSYGILDDNVASDMTLRNVIITCGATTDFGINYVSGLPNLDAKDVLITLAGAGATGIRTNTGNTGSIILDNVTIQRTNTALTGGTCATIGGGLVSVRRCNMSDKNEGATPFSVLSTDIRLSGQSVFIYNNTLDGGKPLLLSQTAGDGKASIKNNIFVSAQDVSGSTCIAFIHADAETNSSLDYNCYWRAGGTVNAVTGILPGGDSATFADWQTDSGQEANGIEGDPSFVDRDASDYTLGGSSICLNTGLDIGLGFVGSGPDIGANELTVSTNQTTGIYDFKQADGTQYPLCVAAGTVFIFDRTPEVWESGFTAIGAGFSADADSFWDFVTDSDIVWLMGADEALHKWNGSTETAGTVTLTLGDATVVGSGTAFTNLGEDGKFHVTATGEVLTIASVTTDTALELTENYAGATDAGLEFVAYTYQPADGSPPAGKYLEVYENHLFLAGNTTNRSRLWWSNLKDFETWSAADFIDINRKDGDPIKALFVLGDYLYVGKEDSLWRVEFTGDISVPFTLSRVADVGVRSNWSVVGSSTVKFFLSADGIYMIPVSGLPQKISSDIEPSILATTTSDWEFSSALFHPEFRELWMYFRADNTVYFFDLQRQAWGTWTGWDFNLLGQVENTDDSWQGYGGDDSGNMFTLDTGTSDNGSAIDFQIDTRAYDFGSAAMQKQLRQLIFQASKDSTWSLVFSHRRDFDEWTNQTILSTADESQGTGLFKKRVNIDTENIGEYFEFRFRNNQADKAFKLYGWSPMLQPLGKR